MAEKYLKKGEDAGNIFISEDVIIDTVIASIKDVPGVAGLANTVGAELAELVGLKTISKGVKVSIDDKIRVDAIITVYYGFNILTVAKEVQDNVVNVLESATGLDGFEVNIHVSGISFDKNS